MAKTIYDKMETTWCLVMLLCALASADAGAYFYSPGHAQYASHGDLSFPYPLTILPERPYAAAPSLSPIPLYIVPKGLIRVLDPHAFAGAAEVTPGVRVVLRRPLVISAPTATISFPSGFTVGDEPGVSTHAMNVGAVLAPVHTAAAFPIQYPITIRIVYAVATVEPASFLPPQPSYLFPQHFYNYPQYAYQTALAVPQQKPGIQPEQPATPSSTPFPDVIPPQQSESESEQDKPGAPPAGSPQLVTVLDFPSSVASPGSLFFQPPQTGEELGNREPPQAVVPAGIVQSAAPIPNLSVFVNSKESQYLQVLREEALKAKTPQRTPSYIYHGDTVQVDAL